MGGPASHSYVNGFFMLSNVSLPPRSHVGVIHQGKLALVILLSELKKHFFLEKCQKTR
jgi:hypothetical protein